jgi:hypothetical protein
MLILGVIVMTVLLLLFVSMLKKGNGHPGGNTNTVAPAKPTTR